MDTRLLIMIFLLMIEKNKEIHWNGLHSLSSFINSIEIDSKYTIEKIRIVKKVGPYFPEQYIPVINNSILITEKLIKINELVEFMKKDEYEYIKEPIAVANNKDRMSKIVGTIQKEIPKSEIKNLGTVMDLVINMDKYKKMFNLLTSMINDQDSLKDTTQLLNLVAPLLGNENQKDNDKLKEMNKMMEIFKLLNTPKKDPSKETPKDDKKIEIIEKQPKE